MRFRTSLPMPFEAPHDNGMHHLGVKQLAVTIGETIKLSLSNLALRGEFGHALRGRLRKSDISCRYGGDEFLLILPDSSVESTQERLEHISIFMRELPIQYGEQTLGVVTV